MPRKLQATGTPGIVKDEGGNLWLRSKVGGARKLRKLSTRDMATARMALRVWQAELETAPAPVAKVPGAKDCWSAAVAAWLEDKEGRADLSPATQKYYAAVAKELAKLAPLDGLPRAIGKPVVSSWHRELCGRQSANFANVCLAAARSIFRDQRARGLRRDDPSDGLRKMRVSERRLRLPEPEDFDRIVASIASQNARCSKVVAQMVRWLAYSGLRISEMRALRWEDVEDGRLVVRSAKSRGGAAKFRVVPMVAALEALVAEMRAEWAAAGREPEGPVFDLESPRAALENACKRLKLPHLRVHDLRHFFATTCIEAGVDIPTVSRWLGHSDGGALAMRTYGHLRDAHSLAAARRVMF